MTDVRRLWYRIRTSFVFLALSSAYGDVRAEDCEPIDFLEASLSAEAKASPEKYALELAYRGVSVDEEKEAVSIAGTILPFHDGVSRDATALLTSGSIRDQFYYPYPLDFDLVSRATPWNDPGRVRNTDFFFALYGSNQREVERSLVRVALSNGVGPTFHMSKKHGVACQMLAALEYVYRMGSIDSDVFKGIGGSFYWRRVEGTSRLSAHSFGIAFDLNPGLGGYWKWSGSVEGNVGHFENKIPQGVVQAFERFGFIWGGKWHHFDGMHFEYRPEIVLYARLTSKP